MTLFCGGIHFLNFSLKSLLLPLVKEGVHNSKALLRVGGHYFSTPIVLLTILQGNTMPPAQMGGDKIIILKAFFYDSCGAKVHI